MQVLLHAGIDKAGSTAIQAHLHANRGWLEARGVYLPESGLTRYGHRGLFAPGPDPQVWSALAEELASAQRAGVDWAILSFEGVCMLPRERIALLADRLAGFKTTYLFYLRDQAAVLQSGYLQNLKAGPQPWTIEQLRDVPQRLPLESRDYLKMLAPFREALGHENLLIRPYAKDLLEGGDIVADLLKLLNLNEDDSFERLSLQQNPSLDVSAARYLNERDQCEGESGREALVDDLLWIIRRDGAGQRWFFDRETVLGIRDHYRLCNQRLLREFGLAQDVETFFGQSTPAWSASPGNDEGIGLANALQNLWRWPRWRGSRAMGHELAPFLEGGGWHWGPTSDEWTCGDQGRIRFRVPLSRYAQKPRDLQVKFTGQYQIGGLSTELLVNGHSIGEHSLDDCAVDVTAHLLGSDREVDLQLLHRGKLGISSPYFSLRALDLKRL